MAGKRSAEFDTEERSRKKKAGDANTSSQMVTGEGETAKPQNKPGDVANDRAAAAAADVADARAVAVNGDKSAEGANSDVKTGSGSAVLDSEEESDSLDSDVGSDLLTNVEGQDDVPSPKRVKLTGVQIVDDDESENIGMQNVAKLLRRQRYHDDDISQAAAAPRISLSRCFRCLLPGHMARDCPNPAKEKPCTNCAGYGHAPNRCPKSMCYRCNGFGHVASECQNSDAIADARVCVRCGATDCSASGGTDWHRVHRGCRQEYSRADLHNVRCFVCGKQGHFCCEPAPTERTSPTCCLCGSEGHTGLLDGCPDPLPKFLRAEAHQAQRRRDDSGRSVRARTGDHNRGGNVYDDIGHHYRSGPTRLDTGRSGSGYHVRHDDQYSGRQAQGGAARAHASSAAQPAARTPAAAAGGNRYGPQRYGYGPVEPPKPVQNPSYGSGGRRRGFQEIPQPQYAHGGALQAYAASAHPPPDMVTNGGHRGGGAYSAGGHHAHGDPAMWQGGHVVVMQEHQEWRHQAHDISMRTQQQHDVAMRSRPQGYDEAMLTQQQGYDIAMRSQQQAHDISMRTQQHDIAMRSQEQPRAPPGQAQHPHTGAAYYMTTSTGQGTYRRWA